MRKTKQGVSLIVLVITIIVMIVLASAVIISLSNTDIINRANEAVDEANLKEVQSLATLAWSEAFLENQDVKDAATRKQNITNAVNKALTDAGVNLNNYYITVTLNGVDVKETSLSEITADGVPIPRGFVKSPYPNEGTKNGGLVIYALTPDEIKDGKTTITDDYDVALRSRNQFVWVPVDSNNFETLFRRKDFMNTTSRISYTLGKNYWELILESNNMPSDNTKNTTNYVSPATLKEATEMYASVKKYGGFYIARYEVGAKTVTNDADYGYIATRATKDNISNLSVTMGKYPYNRVAWGTSMSNDGAVSLARAFYPSTGTTYGVVSTLTYGVQWDRTLDWWEEMDALDGKDDLDLADSVSYGVYFYTTIASTDLNDNAEYSICNTSYKLGSWEDLTAKSSNDVLLATTGAYTKANVYNIYDMAGNLYEWTMEGETTGDRVLRGGGFDFDGDGRDPVAYRRNDAPTNVYNLGYGFRPSLYIK